MKKSFSKTISILLALMFVFTAAFAISASAETTVIKDNSSLNNVDSATGTIDKFKGARDIYLVLDISGSMNGIPMQKMQEAAKQFCALMLNDKTGDNRIAIITYGTKAESYSFSKDYSTLANIIDGLKAKGSTDMYDALMAVKEMNEKVGNTSATKHVVVMADGLPNESATMSTGKYTSKDSKLYYKYGNAVYSTAAGMWSDYYIYSIGFFHSLSGSELKFGKTLMKDIQNALYLEVYDPNKIIDAFNGVADNITKDSTSATSSINGGTGDKTTSTTTTKKADNNNNNNNNNNGNGNGNGSGTIPQTGDSSIGIAIAAIVMLSGIAVVATRKHDK